MLGWSGKHKIDQQPRTVSVWDQLLKGLKQVLIRETFYGVEKGTNIIKMILEQGNFFPGLDVIEGMRQRRVSHVVWGVGVGGGELAVVMELGCCWGHTRERGRALSRMPDPGIQ